VGWHTGGHNTGLMAGYWSGFTGRANHHAHDGWRAHSPRLSSRFAFNRDAGAEQQASFPKRFGLSALWDSGLCSPGMGRCCRCESETM
jgi:hypothetical protein